MFHIVALNILLSGYHCVPECRTAFTVCEISLFVQPYGQSLIFRKSKRYKYTHLFAAVQEDLSRLGMPATFFHCFFKVETYASALRYYHGANVLF